MAFQSARPLHSGRLPPAHMLHGRGWIHYAWRAMHMFNVPAFVNTAVAVPKSSIAPVDTAPLTDQLLACAWSCRDVEGTVDTSVVRCSATIAHGGGGSRVAPRCAVFTDALYYTRRLSAAGGAAGICCRGTANNVCVCVK